MKNKTEEEIRRKVVELWPNLELGLSDNPIKIRVGENRVDITLSDMYQSPGLSFSRLSALAEFFATKNINDDDAFSESGCETCDYGSSYGFTLVVRPDAKV